MVHVTKATQGKQVRLYLIDIAQRRPPPLRDVFHASFKCTRAHGTTTEAVRLRACVHPGQVRMLAKPDSYGASGRDNASKTEAYSAA